MTLSTQVVEPQIRTRTECNSNKLPQGSPVQDCLKSLAFSEMKVRSNDIKSAAEGTCEWLLRHEMYKSWAAHDQGLLWIKGKPGSGKSTLLRYALDNVEKAPSFRDEDLVLSFFFYNLGTELQKTLLGFLRSLLYQILDRVPNAVFNVVNSFQKWHDTISKPDEEYKWSLPELERFLMSSLQKILETCSIWLFVDALDEAGRDNAISTFSYFRSMLQKPLSADFRIRICFTCRHYPILDTGDASGICLESENEKDISIYVRDQLSVSLTLTASEIPNLITKRAKGVFLWVRFVVKRALILEGDRKGLKEIEKEINSIPADLGKLYSQLVQSMNERPASLKLFRWICFAIRPLTLDELRWAMIVDPDCQRQSLRDCESTEEYPRSSERMGEKVRVLSCGLAEVIMLSNKTTVVQFIHQSVQDFCLDRGLAALHDGLEVADTNLFKPGFAGSLRCLLFKYPIHAVQLVRDHFRDKNNLIVGQAHYKLSRTCIRYLAMEELARIPEELAQIEEGSVKRRRYNSASFESKYPLLKYATNEWLTHVLQSDRRNVSQDDLLRFFAWPSESLLQRWASIKRALYVWDGSQGDPSLDCRLIHLASVYNLKGLLQIILQKADPVDPIINAKDEYNRTPLSYAAMLGNEAIVKLLVKQDDVVVDSKDKKGRTPLSHAAEYGNETIVKLLVERNDVVAD